MERDRVLCCTMQEVETLRIKDQQSKEELEKAKKQAAEQQARQMDSDSVFERANERLFDFTSARSGIVFQSGDPLVTVLELFQGWTKQSRP